MRRLFSKAATSTGTVVLRLALAAALHLDALGHFVTTGPQWLVALTWLCSAALVVGFLSPIFAVVAAVVELTAFFGAGGENLWPAVAAVNAIALFLLGPGDYSLDARLFGRRTVVMTSPTRTGRS